MKEQQKVVRLTIRLPEELDHNVREEAEQKGLSVNQFVLSVLNQWRKSRHSGLHTP